MRDILLKNEEAFRAAGTILTRIGEGMMAGEMEYVATLLEKLAENYPEWAELEDAIAGIECTVGSKEDILAVAKAVGTLVGALVGAALKAGLG